MQPLFSSGLVFFVGAKAYKPSENMIEQSAFRRNEIANTVSLIVIDRQSIMMSSFRKWSLKALGKIRGLPCETPRVFWIWDRID